MADQKIVSEEALTAIASDIKTAIGTKADSSNVYTKSATDTLLDGKANTEGEYDGLTVGNAKQLVATVGEIDKTPYLFRTAGGSIDIGDRETDELVGGTVAFNQLVKYPLNVISVTTSDTGIKSVQSNISFVGGHKYLVSYRQKATLTSNTRNTLCYVANGRKYQSASENRNLLSGFYYWLFNCTDTVNEGSLEIWCNAPSNNVDFDLFNLIDLTQMFGGTIADYIYSLEQATEGSGVNFFRKLFPYSHYAYNEGSLKSVKTSGHKLTGFNAWDEVTELGQYDTSTGQPKPNNYCIRGKNPIKILPDTAYYCSNNNIRRLYYDANDNYISADYGYGVKVTPSNAYIMRVYLSDTYGTTYKNDVCINLSWDGERNGEYEPYEVNTYPLDSDLELRGIPKLDADNKLYYDGDEYESTGDVTRKYGIVDLGSLNWNADSNRAGVFYTNGIASLIKQPVPNASAQILASKFYTMRNASVPAADSLADADKTISSYPSYGGGYIFVVDLSHASDDAATFKTAMSGVYLVYELATPTTEQAEPYTNPQIVNDFGTEEYIDDRAVAIPVGHNTFYEVNLRAKLEMSPDSPESNGDYLMRHTSEGNAYTPYVSPIPSLPSADGNYVLKCTVSGSTKTLTWVEET